MNTRKKRVWAVAFSASMGLPAYLRSDEGAGGVAGEADVCCGAIGDLDADCDVDLQDHALMQQNFTGPPLLVNCCFDAQCDDGDPCTIDTCDEVTGECSSSPAGNCGGTCEVGGSCSQVLPCDTPLTTGSISPATENDFLCICVNHGDTVRITVLKQPGQDPTFTTNWRLLDSAGNPAGACGAFTTVAAADCGPLPSAGNPYQIQIQDSGQNMGGTYFAGYIRLPAASACDELPIACDEVVSGIINHDVDGDLLSLTVIEGETLRVTVVETAGGGGNFNPVWRLIDGAGRPARFCGSFSGASEYSRDCGPLPAAGNPHQIEVEDSGANDEGPYQAHFLRSRRVQGCETTVDCDGASVESIDEPGDGDRFSFLAAEAEIVRVSVIEQAGAGAAFAPSWRLVDGSGAAAVSCGGLTGSVSLNCGPLPASGNPYRIEVEDGGRNEIGDYALHFQRLTAVRACDDVPLICGVGQTGTIDHAADADLLGFAVAEGTTVTISVVEPAPGSSFNPNWRLIDGAGNPATACGSFSVTSPRDCTDLAAALNPYRVEVEDQGRNETGTYVVTVDYLGGCPD